ncbi:hypothetical protein FB451DRAFT_1189106 [Mycena latifolia]|nr:hypothetical protein FB451DRAFT_1193899 [Mycena latifolia]KAJ7445435.1 hypothetical protein FB451DRAFT_1189106 [Mycena latifolia]
MSLSASLLRLLLSPLLERYIAESSGAPPEMARLSKHPKSAFNISARAAVFNLVSTQSSRAPTGILARRMVSREPELGTSPTQVSLFCLEGQSNPSRIHAPRRGEWEVVQMPGERVGENARETSGDQARASWIFLKSIGEGRIKKQERDIPYPVR